MKDGMTIREAYGPAMEITDQRAADEYFDQLVQYHMQKWNKTREEAEATERINLGYYAGYYDSETRRRVEKLFKCTHPIFGSIEQNGSPTPEQAFEMGKACAGKQSR